MKITGQAGIKVVYHNFFHDLSTLWGVWQNYLFFSVISSLWGVQCIYPMLDIYTLGCAVCLSYLGYLLCWVCVQCINSICDIYSVGCAVYVPYM